MSANAERDDNPIDGARALLRRAIMSIAVPWGEKNPAEIGWQKQRITEADLPRVFGGKRWNVGMLLGHITDRQGRVYTDRFMDVDLDNPHALKLAPSFLPPTEMIWGRASKRRSHYGYRLTSAEGVKGKQEFNKIELRFTGHQTLAPGSCNTQSGHPERVEWDVDGMPGVSEHPNLQKRVKALAAAAKVLENWTEGNRHSMALPLAGMLARGGMDEKDAIHFVHSIASAADESDSELMNRIACVKDTYAKASQNQPYTAATALETFLPADDIELIRQWLDLTRPTKGVLLMGPDGLPLAHDGDAERFVKMWGGKVIYCEAEKRWYLYDGVRWKADETKAIRECGKQTADAFRALVGEKFASGPSAFGSNGVGTVKSCTDWALWMGNDAHITAMLSSASSHTRIAVAASQLDAHPEMLNVLDWTIDLDTTTGHVSGHEHRAEDYLTMVANVRYNASATAAGLDEYLAMFFPEADRRNLLQEIAAYALTGYPKRYSLELIGLTNAGKSMTLKLVSNLFGDYADKLEYTSLMKNPHGSGGDVARPDLWRVRRKRLVTIAEVPPDAHFDVALFKTLLSGGDKMPVRTFYDASGGSAVEWALTLWFSGNKEYGPPPGEEAAYERMIPLRCDHQVPEGERDDAKQLAILTSAEVHEALLAWILQGFQRLYGTQHGHLTIPEVVRNEKTALRDTLDRWSTTIEELFVLTSDDNDGVLKSEAWERVRDSLEFEGEHIRNGYTLQRDFEASLERRGAVLAKSSGRFNSKKYWKGVRWSNAARGTYRTMITLPDWKEDGE